MMRLIDRSFTLQPISEIVQRQQIEDYSCVPCCMAMAFGLDEQEVIDDMRLRGIRVQSGLHFEDQLYWLAEHRCGAIPMSNLPGLALMPGHYLGTVASMNQIGRMHAILIVCEIAEGERPVVMIYDPCNGKEGKAFHDTDSWRDITIEGFLRLEDFRDYHDRRTEGGG